MTDCTRCHLVRAALRPLVARIALAAGLAAAYALASASPARAAESASFDLTAPRPAFGMTPRFVGVLARDAAPPLMSRDPALESAGGYMTAAEMQEAVVALTGFYHPAFQRYADVLGRFDPATGQRTTDRPTLISVFFLQQIATSVAEHVVARELFLADDERVVFPGVDLSASPSEADLATELDALHTRWLGLPVGDATLGVLSRAFRETEAAAGVPQAYGRVLQLLLQHGALYYY